MVSNFNLVMCDSDLRKNILDKAKPLRDKLLLDMEIDDESNMIIHICDKVLELDIEYIYDYIYSKIWRRIDRPPNFNCPLCGEGNECDCVLPHIFTEKKYFYSNIKDNWKQLNSSERETLYTELFDFEGDYKDYFVCMECKEFVDYEYCDIRNDLKIVFGSFTIKCCDICSECLQDDFNKIIDRKQNKFTKKVKKYKIKKY